MMIRDATKIVIYLRYIKLIRKQVLTLHEVHIYRLKANRSRNHWTNKIADTDGLYLFRCCLHIC